MRLEETLDGKHLTKGLYMVIKMVISLKALAKTLYEVKCTNFIDLYDLKARLLLCGEYFEETPRNVNLNHICL
jgi:hypothetical protein